jgi:hypothetical protein
LRAGFSGVSSELPHWSLPAAWQPWRGMAALVVLQLSHGLTFGATHLGSIFLLSRLAAPGLRTQAQGWLAAMWALFMAALTSLSGQLSLSLGQGIYLPMAGAAVAGLVLLLPIALRQSRRPRPRWGRTPQSGQIGMGGSRMGFWANPSLFAHW